MTLLVERREFWWDLIRTEGPRPKVSICGIGEMLDEPRLLDLWRITRLPIILFRKRESAKAVLKWALTAVDSDYSLRFAKLPTDPDTLIQKRGPEALEKAVEASQDLMGQLWSLTTEGSPTGSPEALRAIELEMYRAIEPIPDEKLWTKYSAEVGEKVRKLAVQGRTVIRSNGFSHHSTSPSSLRIGKIERVGFSLREAEIVVRLAKDPLGADVDKLASIKVSDRTKKIISEIIDSSGSIASVALGRALTEARETLQRAGIST